MDPRGRLLKEDACFIALITIAVILILYGAVSRPLDARGITSAMIFTAAGLCVGTSALKLVNIHLESLTAERICELALVFLLFSDATRIDLAALRRHLGWPSRLLLIGLPLTILAGLGAGLLVFPAWRWPAPSSSPRWSARPTRRSGSGSSRTTQCRPGCTSSLTRPDEQSASG
jgi:NhaP-type Na+/H+ or K+/H+ antiporter